MDGPSADALLARLREGNSLYLLHVNADPDCVGSAYALHEAFGGTVGAPDGLSKAGANLARRLAFAIDLWPHPENFSTIVAVDTSSRSQLGRLGARAGSPFLVDHHRYGDLLAGAPAAAWDPDRASCCEVVLSLLDRAGHAPSPAASRALLAGLVTDSARFKFADPFAFEAASRLLRASGSKMEEVLTLLDDAEEEEGDDTSRRHACLVAGTRARIEKWGPHLVATSEVGAFDAAAAASLVRAGADLAIVACEKSATSRMSLRASPRLMAAGIHLGELANIAAGEVGWSGGGHEGAAGLNGKPPGEPARSVLLRLARAKLGVS